MDNNNDYKVDESVSQCKIENRITERILLDLKMKIREKKTLYLHPFVLKNETDFFEKVPVLINRNLN